MLAYLENDFFDRLNALDYTFMVGASAFGLDLRDRVMVSNLMDIIVGNAPSSDNNEIHVIVGGNHALHLQKLINTEIQQSKLAIQTVVMPEC